MTEKILIVDDSPSTVMLMKFSLEKENYKVLTASNGNDALGVLENTDGVKCVVTDINMPGISGIDLVKKIRETIRYKFVPVIVLTSADKPDNKRASRRVGATGWIDKPFKPESLLRVVKKTLRK